MERAEFTVGQGFYDRATSSFPLSIGTAMAFESLFNGREPAYDPKRSIPDRINVANYQECYINLATLFRNLNGSVDNAFFMAAKPTAIVDVLLSEMDVIENLFSVEGNGVCVPIFYYSDYDDLEKKEKLGIAIRKANTPNQKTIALLLKETIKLLNRQTDAIVHVSDLLKPKAAVDALMISHHPYDLCAHKSFNSLSLLESHTGVLKTKRQWNSKYYPVTGENMAHLPFHRKLLLVFGDRVQIGPMPIKFRKTIMEASIKRNWTPLTTMEKIKLDLGYEIRDPYALTLFNAL